MSWGTSYKYDGYLSHITINELESRREDEMRLVDMYFRELLAYAAQTPPPTAKNDEGYEYPYPEFLAMKFKEYRECIEESLMLIARIDDCLETLKEHPEDVQND